jgi:hypothetical protein
LDENQTKEELNEEKMPVGLKKVLGKDKKTVKSMTKEAKMIMKNK